MNYNLMHKDILVAEITIDDEVMAISKINEICQPAHIPLGIKVQNNTLDRGALHQWWLSRSIPMNRDGICSALERMKLWNTNELIHRAYSFSLSDQYWMKPKKSHLTWVEMNFFDHEFSEEVGNLLIGGKSKVVDFRSPDNTTEGRLRKRWKIMDGKRCLIKAGSGAASQEPYNEVFASEVNKRLSAYYVPYTLLKGNRSVYSVCENFLTKDTELISAWSIYHSFPKSDDISHYQHYLNCCKELGGSNIEDAMNKMFVLDYLIANTDRHMNNFGMIRNANTLEVIGAAPLFDNGTSLWHNKPASLIHSDTELSCKPFESTHEEQLKLVTSFDFLERKDLVGIGELFKEITRNSIFIEEKRADAISFALDERVEKLFQIVSKKNER